MSTRRMIVWVVVACVVATAGAFVFMALSRISECLGEHQDRPFSWHWSPRRQYCSNGYFNLGLLILLVPSVVIVAGSILLRHGRKLLATTVFALLLLVPFLPSLYLSSLAVYRLDEYPILHDPLLREATAAEPPRACFAYGIITGANETAITPDTERTCVDLAPTTEAVRLTGDYARYDPGWLGERLTEHGLPPKPGPSGVKGLTVTRVYMLSDEEARHGSEHIGD